MTRGIIGTSSYNVLPSISPTIAMTLVICILTVSIVYSMNLKVINWSTEFCICKSLFHEIQIFLTLAANFAVRVAQTEPRQNAGVLGSKCGGVFLFRIPHSRKTHFDGDYSIEVNLLWLRIRWVLGVEFCTI
jgi:hypothetical protein